MRSTAIRTTFDPTSSGADSTRRLPSASTASSSTSAETSTPSATAACRQEILRERLARALPAAKPLAADGGRRTGNSSPEASPLYLGVAQQGSLAISERSGAPLAVAPDHWTDGCPVLVETRSDLGPAVDIRSYLDPETGYALFVEAVPAGAPRSFEIAPTRWLEAR